MNRVLGILLLLTGLSGPSFAGPSEDEASALAFMNDYVASFRHMDARLTARHFNEPMTVVTGSGATIYATQADVAASYVPFFERLASRNYGGSKWTQLRLKALSEGVVIASASAIRYKTDGSDLESTGATYLLRKTPEGWRIAVLTPHPAPAALTLQ